MNRTGAFCKSITEKKEVNNYIYIWKDNVYKMFIYVMSTWSWNLRCSWESRTVIVLQVARFTIFQVSGNRPGVSVPKALIYIFTRPVTKSSLTVVFREMRIDLLSGVSFLFLFYSLPKYLAHLELTYYFIIQNTVLARVQWHNISLRF